MVLDWVIQNIIPILVGALIAVIIEILFKELIFNQFIAPSFIYQINYQKSKFYKWLHNSSTELSYTSSTHNFDNKRRDRDYVYKILKELQKRKIKAYERGDIKIEEYIFGNHVFSGVIEFSTNYDGDMLENLEITLTTQIRYKSLSDDINSIIEAMSKVKEYVSVAIEIPLEYNDRITCKLTRLIKELSFTLNDLKMDYIKFSGKNADVSIVEDKVVFNPPLYTSEILPSLKKLVILYT